MAFEVKSPKAHIHQSRLDLHKNGRSHPYPGTPRTAGGGESGVRRRAGGSAWETLTANDVGDGLREVRNTASADLGAAGVPPAINHVTLGRNIHLSCWIFQHQRAR